MDRDRFDVVIVGGGIMGSAVAYFLAADPTFRGRVAVIEKDSTYARASTALSAGSIRQQFSTPENIRMSQFGVEFLRSLDRHLAVDGKVPDIGFVERGYLFLATAAGVSVLRANHALQTGLGAPISFLAPSELRVRFPWLAVDDLAAGTLGLGGEGWFDPFGLLQAFRRKARALGAVFVEDEVVAVARAGNRIAGVEIGSGPIACGALVNAAGPRAGDVARLAGVELPVRPRKRFVFVFRCGEELPGCPLVIDPSGLWFRPEGAGFIGGISPPEDADPDARDFEVDHAAFEATLWPLLARRVAAFEAVKVVSAWAGHYDYNTFDQNGIVGSHPDIANFYFANGFSGHGVQQAPAVGRAIAELIADGRFRSLDLSRLSYARIAARRPLKEVNVI